MLRIAILDYEVGNVFNLSKVITKLGNNEVFVTNEESIIKSADLLILPGVGAFGAAMETIHKKNLRNSINEFKSTGKTILGICLGMQLLFESSDESIGTKGLSIVPGEVKKMLHESGNVELKIPHTGWNDVIINDLPKNKNYSSINNLPFYFLHSYYCELKNSQHVLGTTSYGGKDFCSAVKADNIVGVQFHPELSGVNGQKLLSLILKETK